MKRVAILIAQHPGHRMTLNFAQQAKRSLPERDFGLNGRFFKMR
jgi:hypothetical protein